jgi:hypothetical protein
VQRARRAPEDLKAPVCPPALSMVGPGRLQLLAELFCFACGRVVGVAGN